MKGELHLPDLPELPVALSPVVGAPEPGERRAQPHWALRLRDKLMGYLPLLVMILLALITWLVAKNTPGLISPSTPGVVKHDPDYTVDHFTLQRFDPDGRKMTATALQGRAKGDGSEVWLDGQAQIVSEAASQPPVQMNGEHLRAEPKLKRVDSDWPVIVQQAGSEFHADGMFYDADTHVLTLRGATHALLQQSLRAQVAKSPAKAR